MTNNKISLALIIFLSLIMALLFIAKGYSTSNYTLLTTSFADSYLRKNGEDNLASVKLVEVNMDVISIGCDSLCLAGMTLLNRICSIALNKEAQIRIVYSTKIDSCDFLLLNNIVKYMRTTDVYFSDNIILNPSEHRPPKHLLFEAGYYFKRDNTDAFNILKLNIKARDSLSLDRKTY